MYSKEEIDKLEPCISKEDKCYLTGYRNGAEDVLTNFEDIVKETEKYSNELNLILSMLWRASKLDEAEVLEAFIDVSDYYVNDDGEVAKVE